MRRVPRSPRLRHSPWVALVLVLAGLVSAATVAAAAFGVPDLTFTPKSEKQVDNIDVARSWIKNYYGEPGAKAGATPATDGSFDWTTPLNQHSNYAREARKVERKGDNWLVSHRRVKHRSIVLDVDDTTLTTFNYELFSNWDFNPVTNGNFVGLTNGAFTGNLFPATPGMVHLVRHAQMLGYAVFFITGRGDAQHAATVANLVNDAAAGLPDITTVTFSGATVPEIDAGYPPATPLDTGHGGFTDGLFTKPPVGSYPAYLDQPQFCGPSIHATPAVACPTIQYKSGTRAYIESQGFRIVANFGDQFSDLKGGFAARTFKMPNPNYFLP
jgi:predicted secreted acid phosphatase